MSDVNRMLILELNKWRKKPIRKPLVLRGARQVGKTTLVEMFAKQFKQYIYINLELAEEKKVFNDFTNIESLVQTIFFNHNKDFSTKSDTLLFLDEIQEVPVALNQLRYFYEKFPEIAVIAAGSMLETIFNKDVSFPVGRVEYFVLRPFTFPEFLDAMKEKSAIDLLNSLPLPEFAHDKLLKLFHTYTLIGGMPEIVSHYAKNKDLTALSEIYDSLIVSYMDDVEKYSHSSAQMHHLRHVIKASYALAGKRIKYEGFGNSTYKSREMSEALRTIEKALLIHIVFPATTAELPLLPDIKKSPRLHVLDTGLMNYYAGIQKEILGTTDLNSVYQGTVIEHMVGQEMLGSQHKALSHLNFWVREKKTSSAEVDYIVLIDGKLIPVEVKSGTEGKLKSLHMYMDMAPHNLAVRIYAGKLSITETKTPKGKMFYLLNLPYYLVSRLEKYVNWMQETI